MPETYLASTTLVILLACLGATSCKDAPEDSPAPEASSVSGPAQASATASSAAPSSSAAQTKPRLEGPGDVALGGTGVAVTLPAGVSLDASGSGSGWFIRGPRASGLISSSWSMPKTAQKLAEDGLCGPKQKKLTTKSLAGGGFLVRCEGPGVQTPKEITTYKVAAVFPIVPPVKSAAGPDEVALKCFHESTEPSHIDSTAEICGSLHKQR
jgi:hypothetical protein